MNDENWAAEEADRVMQDDAMVMKRSWYDLQKIFLKDNPQIPKDFMRVIESVFEAGWAAGSASQIKRIADRLRQLLQNPHEQN